MAGAISNFLKLVGGIPTEEAPVTTGGTGNANKVVAVGAAGTLDPTLFPAGIGSDIVTMPASEALAAGALVNIYTNSGAANARNASAAAGSYKPADGFVLAAVASGGTASVYRAGQCTGLTGLSPGAEYFLSTATAGSEQTAAPATGSGYLSQSVGKAISATVLDFIRGTPVQLI